MKHLIRTHLLLSFILLTSYWDCASAANWYVKIDGHGNGSSWDNALSAEAFVEKLKDGFADNDKVYMAAGTYYAGIEKSNCFSITKGISIIGGFDPSIKGNTTDISHPSKYETIFSGDINRNEKLDKEDADRVLEINTTSQVEIKGINITNGYRCSSGSEGLPAGIDIKNNSDVSLLFCKITRNKTESSAGGIFASKSKLYCYRTVISNNEANNRGAGIRIQNGTTLTLEGCLLANNNLTGEWGGAIQVSGNDNPLYCLNTTITNNTAARGGAAINSPGNVYIVSSTIANNVCSNPDQGHDIRCESTNQMYILNSIVSGYSDYTPNIFVNGSNKSITSAGYNIIGSYGGNGLFTKSENDLIGKTFIDIFGSNILSENGGYPKTILPIENFSTIKLAELETFMSEHQFRGDITKDQRGYNRVENLSISAGSTEKNIPVGTNRIEDLLQKLKDPASEYVFVVAHRGNWREAPENSITAIEKAFTIGADMVEIDIQKTKDGNFVLMHDDNIGRTTNGSGKVSSYTVDELKKFKLRHTDGELSEERIPTLKEALLACKGKILVNIDKGGSYLTEIIPIIRETETEDHVVLKGENSVASVKSILKSNRGIIFMPVVNLQNENANNYIQSFIDNYPPHAMEVSFSKEDFDPKTFNEKIAQSGSRVWINSLWASLCGGHEDEKAMSNPDANWGWILEQRATIIQTDRLKELIEYLQKNGRRGDRGVKIKKAPEGYIPALDGKGSDPIWNKIASTDITHVINGTVSESSNPENHDASFKAFYTSEGIYIYGQRTDNDIVTRKNNSEENIYDYFRIFFNPTGVKDNEISNPFMRPADKQVGDIYPQSRSTMAYVIVGNDENVSHGMMKRWEVFGDGKNSDTWPQLEGDHGQKVLHHIADNKYTFEFFVPFSTIIPKATVLGEISGIPAKIGFNIESYDFDTQENNISGTKNILSWNKNEKGNDSGSDINTFGEMYLSTEEISLKINEIPVFEKLESGEAIQRLSNGSGIWGDYNNDGYLDLFYIGTNINNQWKLCSYLYKNDKNGNFTLETTSIKPLREAACSWIDFDNDGNLDLLIAGSENGNVNTSYTILYKNLGAQGNYAFEEVNNTQLDNISNENEKCYRYIAVGDCNNDGFSDIVITGQNRNAIRKTNLYINDKGTGRFILQNTAFEGGEFRPFSSGSVALGDMDGDGYLDILSNGYGDASGNFPKETGAFKVYRNNQDGTYKLVNFNIDEWGTFLGQCSWADVNNDGYLDFIVTGKYRNSNNNDINQAKIYINDTNGNFTLMRSINANLEPLNSSGMDWCDINNDGYVDLIMNGLGNTSSGRTWVYLNNGDGTFYPYQNAIYRTRTSSVAVADYNNDGLSDVFICGYRDGDNGGSVAEIWENKGNKDIKANTAPNIPENLSTSVVENNITFSWDISSDDFTPSSTIRYNLFIAKDGQTIYMNIPADIQSGFIKTSDISGALTKNTCTLKLESGVYTWGVQAIDNGKLGSPFCTTTVNVSGTGDSKKELIDRVEVCIKNDKIHVNTCNQKADIAIYDSSARVLYHQQDISSGYLNYTPEKGVYFVELIVENTKKTFKIAL